VTPPLDLSGTTVVAAGAAAALLLAVLSVGGLLRRVARRGRPRAAALGGAGALLAAVAVAALAVRTGPFAGELAVGELPTAARAAAFGAAGALGGALLLAFRAAGRRLPAARVLVPLATLATLAMTAGGGALYSELAAGREPPARRAARDVGDVAAIEPGAPSGAGVFEARCRACHSVSGLRAHVDGLPAAAIEVWLVRLDRLRGRMPAFDGTDAERRVLAAWLARLDGADDVAPPPAPDRVGRGRGVARRCLVCHDSIPLRPRVAGWTEDQLHDALGRLPRFDAAMPAFSGTEDERRDLAAYLAGIAAGGAD
jgi:mono/diheme cytochrome c family protein